MSHVYINRALRKDIPSDAVLLTRREALDMQWQTITDWSPKTDTWPFNIGIGILASLNAATNLSIVQHFRDRLKLRNYGRITMALPTTLVPCAISVGLHYAYASSAILLGEDCPLCIQTRAAALHVVSGVVMPFLTTPFAAFFFASTYSTYNIPPLKVKNLPEIFNLWLTLTKKLRTKLPVIIGVNAIAAAGLTYFEADSFYKIQSMIYEKEEHFKRMMADRASDLI